jgi:hypothetical protein
MVLHDFCNVNNLFEDFFFARVIDCEIVNYFSYFCLVPFELNQIHFLCNNYKCRLLLQHMGKHTIHFGNMVRIMNNGIKIIECFQSNITFFFSFVNKNVKIVATHNCGFQSS